MLAIGIGVVTAFEPLLGLLTGCAIVALWAVSLGAARKPLRAAMAKGSAAARPWEQGLAVLILFLSTDALIPLLTGTSGTPTGDRDQGNNPVALAIWSVIYVISFFLLLRQSRHPLSAIFKDKALWLLLILAIVSFGWSVAPLVTLKRAVGLLGTSILGFYLGMRFTRQELLQFLVYALALSAILSLGTVLLFPALGITTVDVGSGTGWRGVFLTKNDLGLAMAMSAVMSILYVIDHRRHRLVGMAILLLSVSLLLLSTSKGALVVLVTLLLFLPLTRLPRWRFGLAIPALMLVISVGGGIGVWLVSNIDSLLGLMGRDITLTGRTQLWAVLWEMIQRHPFLGYGYGGFWLGLQGYSLEVYQTIRWLPTHAHNGLLQLGLALGVVGIALVALSFFRNLGRALALTQHKHAIASAFPLISLVLLVLFNVTESELLAYNSIYWILYVALSTLLCLSEDQQNGSQVTALGSVTIEEERAATPYP